MNKLIRDSLVASVLMLTAVNSYGTAAPSQAAPAAASPSEPQPAAAPANAPVGTNPQINPSGTEPTQYRDTTQASREYHLKGAFLRYVAKYVIFPPASLQGVTINLCVLGQVPVFQGINSINGKVVNDRAIQVIKILEIGEAKTQHCQIVFIAKTETDRIKDIINALKDQPIIGFGDMDTYAQAGGQMNFYIANNHLAIMTNMPAVEHAKLGIDPQMLKLVTFVPKVSQ